MRNVIRILLRIHLAPERMARYQKIRQRKAKMKQEKKNFSKHPKRQMSYFMDELALAIINNRPIFVVQKIIEKLNMPIENQDIEIQSEVELDEWDMTTYHTVSEGDDIEDMEDMENTEEEEEIITEAKVIKETSAKTIRALVSIVRMLTESAKIQRTVTSDDIQKAAFRETTFTEKEKVMSAKIVNFLRPFIQKRTIDNQLPEPHILTCAPLAALANSIVIIAGFPSLVRRLSITSKNDFRALHLTAAGVYDAFHKQYDIQVDNTNWITNSYQAGRNKPATFKAFFNMKRVESLMDSYGLNFAWRMTFINRWTVRLLGKAKSGKTFIKSNYEEQKKKSIKPILVKTSDTLDRLNVEAQADVHMKKIRSITNILTPLRKEISRLELQRMEIGRKVRRSQWDPGSDNYRELKKIRQEILIKRLKVIKLEKDLSTARSLLYSVNKALNFASTTHTITSENEGSSDKAKKKFGIEKEDYIEKVRFI